MYEKNKSTKKSQDLKPKLKPVKSKPYKPVNKVRRGGGFKCAKQQNLKIISTNSAGDKFDCLSNLLKNTNANVVTLQETKTKKKIQFENFVVFQAKRTKSGGGSLLGIHKGLEPMLISLHENEFELIVAEVKASNKEIRFITGYGPQENWIDSEKMPFFIALDQEIEAAESAGKSIVITMDANSKLGTTWIPNDPNEISENGEILAEIVKKYALTVLNGSSEKCSGVITRERNTVDGRREKRAIDVVIIIHDLLDLVKHMKINMYSLKTLKLKMGS